MKRFRKTIALLTMVTLLLTALTACSKTAPTEPTQSGSTDESATVEGTVTICLDPFMKPAFDQFIARFEDQNPGIKIEAMYGKDQNALIAANQAPDLIKSGDLHVASSKDILLDLTAYIERDADEVNMEDFFPATTEALKVDGKYLALPTSFNVGLLYYNKTLFDASGVAYPTNTWSNQDFIDAGKALTKQEGDQYTQWGCSTVLGWWGEWLIHVRQAGGDWMVDNQCALDSKEAVQGLQFFYDKTTKGTGAFAPSTTDDAMGGFAGGKTAMEYGGHTGLWVSYNAVSDLNWDIEVLPSGLQRVEGGEFAVEGYAISKSSKNADAAWEVLKYWTSEDGTRFMNSLGYPSARQSVATEAMAVPMEERSNPKNIEALYAAVDKCMPLPKDPNFMNCTQNIVQPIIDTMLEGKITPEEAGKEATKQANDYLVANS